MKEEYEDRLQRAKNKLQEERARRKSRSKETQPEERGDDASFCGSEVSKTSRLSYKSEYSRASSKGPRSEWRNRAQAVIERGKSWKEEAELLRDDASVKSGRSSNFMKNREAEIDSLVERNALLNERERLLKVENELLNAAEAAARAEDRAKAEAYLGKNIQDETDEEFEGSLGSLSHDNSVATTRTSTSCRAKRIREDEANDLNRSFQQAKNIWEVRCNDPTPIKSNHSHYQTSRALEDKPTRISGTYLDIPDEAEMENMPVEFPGSPDSAKSAKSTRSTKSSRFTKSGKSAKSARSEQLFTNREKGARTKGYENQAPTSPQSAKSAPRTTEGDDSKPLVDPSFLATLGQQEQDENKHILADKKRSFQDRRSTSSYRQKLVDPLESVRDKSLVDEEESESSPKESDRVHQSSATASSTRSKYSYQSKRNDVPDEEFEDMSSKRSMSNKEYLHESSASISSIRSKYSSHRKKNDDHDDEQVDGMSSKRQASLREYLDGSSASVSSNRKRYSYGIKKNDDGDDEQFDDMSSRRSKARKEYLHGSSASVSSSRSKHSCHSKKKNEERDEEEFDDMSSKRSRSQKEYLHGSSASVSSSRSKHSYHSKKQAVPDEDFDDMSSKKSLSKDSYRMKSSASVSSYKSNRSSRSNRSKYSYHSKKHDDLDIQQEDFENMLPEELSIPMIIQDLENGPPSQRRELSYREKSALLASMEISQNESGADESGPSERSLFRQHGQRVKSDLGARSSNGVRRYKNVSQSDTSAVAPALKEQKNLYNTKSSMAASKHTVTMPKKAKVQEDNNVELTNLSNENRELKARLEKERSRRSELDEKTTSLQLEVHKKGQEVDQLKLRKDVTDEHKEELYKLEDALQQTNRHLVTVVDENVQIREDFENERALRCKAESAAEQYQAKLKKRTDECAALSKQMHRKEEMYQNVLLEQRHLREKAEDQLAKACHHIKRTEEERDEDFEELEKQNRELRNTVKRMENYLKHKFLEQQGLKQDGGMHSSRRQSGASLQQSVSSKPSMISEVISEMTTDYDYEELNRSQMGEI